MPLALAAFTALDWGVLVGYMLVVLAIGAVVASRRRGDSDDFFLAQRSMPVWAVALSIVATTLSAATFIGAPQEAYAGNLTYLILNIGQVAAAVVAAVVFVPIFYRAGTTTIYGYLGERFGPNAMIAGSAAFLIGRLLASGARLFMAGIVFSLMLFGDTDKAHLIPAIVLFGIVGTAYTIAGGIRAVIWTDVFQIIIVIGAALLSVILLLQKIPLNIGQIITVLGDEVSQVHGDSKLRVVDWSLDPSRPYTLWTGIFAAMVFNLGWYVTDHDLVQRVMSCRSPLRASLSLVSSMVVSVPVTLLFMIIGLLLFIYYGRPDLMGEAAPAYALGDTSKVYPLFLLRELPPGLTGLALAGLFAVAMGSLDSAVNAMAASAVADLYLPWRNRHQRDRVATNLTTPRLAVALMGVTLTGFAVVAALMYDPKNDTLITFALGVMTFAWSGLVGVFLTAAFTKRGNATSVIAALLAGAVTVALLKYGLPPLAATLDEPRLQLAWLWQMVIGTAVSVATCAAGKTRERRGEIANCRSLID